jgi:hypothetical protein
MTQVVSLPSIVLTVPLANRVLSAVSREALPR